MFVAFHELPATARVWIYQASRPLTDTELTAVQPALQQFAEAWTSHGRTLRASLIRVKRPGSGGNGGARRLRSRSW